MAEESVDVAEEIVTEQVEQPAATVATIEQKASSSVPPPAIAAAVEPVVSAAASADSSESASVPAVARNPSGELHPANAVSKNRRSDRKASPPPVGNTSRSKSPTTSNGSPRSTSRGRNPNSDSEKSWNAYNKDPPKAKPQVVIGQPSDEEKVKRKQWVERQREQEQRRQKQEADRVAAEEARKKQAEEEKLEKRRQAVKERIMRQRELQDKLQVERLRAEEGVKEWQQQFKGKPLYEKLDEEYQVEAQRLEEEKRRAYDQELAAVKNLRPAQIISGQVKLPKAVSPKREAPVSAPAMRRPSPRRAAGMPVASPTPSFTKKAPGSSSAAEKPRAAVPKPRAVSRVTLVDRACSPIVFSSDQPPGPVVAATPIALDPPHSIEEALPEGAVVTEPVVAEPEAAPVPVEEEVAQQQVEETPADPPAEDPAAEVVEASTVEAGDEENAGEGVVLYSFQNAQSAKAPSDEADAGIIAEEEVATAPADELSAPMQQPAAAEAVEEDAHAEAVEEDGPEEAVEEDSPEEAVEEDGTAQAVKEDTPTKQ